MKKNPVGGILFLILVIFGVIYLRKSVNTSDNQVAEDLMFVGDILVTLRFLGFMAIILLIIGLVIKNKK